MQGSKRGKIGSLGEGFGGGSKKETIRQEKKGAADKAIGGGLHLRVKRNLSKKEAKGIGRLHLRVKKGEERREEKNAGENWGSFGASG